MMRRILAMLLSVVMLTAAFPVFAEEAEVAAAPETEITEAPAEESEPEPTEASAPAPTEAPVSEATEVPGAEPTQDAETSAPEETPEPSKETEAPEVEETAEPEITPEASAEPVETRQPELEPLELLMTAAVRSAFVGDAVQYKLKIHGGEGQLTASYWVMPDGEQYVVDSATNAVTDGTDTYTYVPASRGQYAIHAVVTDEAGRSAEAIATLTVAEHDTTSLYEWSKRTQEVKLTGDWREDLVAIAQTQLGYAESATDFVVFEDGSRRGYSIYGDWMGKNYADWCASFISFCLNYAGIPGEAFPRKADAEQLLEAAQKLNIYANADSCAPSAGDVVFFVSPNETLHAGIVEAATENRIEVIGGDGTVSRGEYDLNDAAVIGYASMEAAMRRAGKIADATPETETTPEPEATMWPVVSMGPVVSLDPGETLAPDATMDPFASLEPVASLDPDATLEPEDEDGIMEINDPSSQDYGPTYPYWSKPILSYMVEDGSGYMSVELLDTDDGKIILVKYLNDSFERQSYKYIDTELSLFGGFYAGTNAYYLVFGQTNYDEDDSVEVIRVVKYDKNWNRVGAASLRGANTTVPFDAGSLRMTESGNYLYVRTSHEMYTSEDGLNHQSNLTIQVRTSDMTIVDASYAVAYKGGYVSHSFNQFIITDDDGNLVALDHGDAYPRSIVLTLFANKASEDALAGYYMSVDIFPLYGDTGANYTGASIGGLEYSSSHYLVAGSSVVQDGNSHSASNIFLSVVNRDDLSSSYKWITNYSDGGSASATTPQLVKLGSNSFLLLWEKDRSNLCYVFLDGAGNLTSPIYTQSGALSDCKPVVKNGVVSWYVTDAVCTITYSIKSDGSFSSTTKDFAGVAAPSGTFGENNALKWTVDENYTLTISGKGAIPDMGFFGQPWNKQMSVVKKIVIEEGVTAIGELAFHSHPNVTSVTIPSSVSKIDYFAFSECDSLTNITIKSEICWIAGMGRLNGKPAYPLGDPQKVTVSAYLDSDARDYAEEYGYSFKLLLYDAPKLTGTEVTSTGIKITWGKHAKASKYRVYYKTGSGSFAKLADTTSTSYTWTKPVSGTNYSFTVRCLDNTGKTVISEFDKNGLSITYNSTPKITAVENDATGVKVTWDAVTGAKKYRVYYKTGSSGYTKAADTTATSYTWTKAVSGTSYTFTVRCMDSAGTTFTSYYDATGKSITYVAAPKLTNAEVTSTGVKVSWDKVTGAGKYRVYYKAGSGSYTTLADTTATSYTLTKVSNDTTYSFRVRCLNSAGTSVISSYASGLSITYNSTPKITAVENDATGVKVTWGAVTGAKKYRLYYKTASQGYTKVADTTSTSYTWTKAVSGTSYTFTVRCMDSAGTTFTSYYDATGKSITYVAAPKLTNAEVTSTGIKVSWDKVTGAGKYRVYYKAGSGSYTTLGDTSSTSYTLTKVSNNTTYSFRVRCLNSAGTSVISSYESGLSITYNSTPKITAVENDATGVKVTWDAVTGAKKYRLYYKTASQGYTKVADTTSTSYTWTKAVSGTSYTFTVRCMDSAGTTFTSYYDAAGKSITYVAAPKLTKAEVTSTGVKVTWGAVNGAGKYRVYYKVGSGSYTTLADTTATSYTLTKVSNNTTYSFRVRCLNSAGTSVLSSYESGLSITYNSTPKLSKVENVSTGIKISWGAVSGASKYRVYYRTGTSGSFSKLADTTSNSYTWTGPVSGTTYSFTVRCLDSAGTKVTSSYDPAGLSITYTAKP